MPTGIYPRKPLSEETKRKIGLAVKGHTISAEGRLKVSIANKGKHYSPTTEFKKGVKLSPEIIKKRSLKNCGEKNNKWKRGRFLREGYVFIQDKLDSRRKEGYTREHIKVMEAHLGRKLTSKERVHHLDFDRSNNKIDNLYLFKSNGYHMNYHRFLRKLVKMELLGIKYRKLRKFRGFNTTID